MLHFFKDELVFLILEMVSFQCINFSFPVFAAVLQQEFCGSFLKAMHLRKDKTWLSRGDLSRFRRELLKCPYFYSACISGGGWVAGEWSPLPMGGKGREGRVIPEGMVTAG